MFRTDKDLSGSAFRLHGIRGTVQVIERQTVLESVTEFARFRVNEWQRKKICPFKIFPYQCNFNAGYDNEIKPKYTLYEKMMSLPTKDAACKEGSNRIQNVPTKT